MLHRDIVNLYCGEDLGNSARENSTEKLLDAIRGPGQQNPKISVSKASYQISKLVNLKTIKKKTLNLGILLAKRDITFVLTVEKGINKRKFLIKWATIRIPESLNIEDEGYSTFLGLNLNEFTEGCKGISVWCTIDSTHLKFRNILIPDVVKSKIANTSFWGLKREIDFNAEEEIFDFEVISDIKSEGHKKKVFASIVKKEQVHKLQAIFSKAGYNLKGITAIPFAIQNFIHTNHLQVKDSPFSVINLSRENSEMFCFSDSGILMARKVRSDLYSLVADAVRSSGKDTIESFSSIKDFQSDKNFQIRQSCERLTDKIVRTGEYCSQNFANNTPMKKFVIFGETDDSDSFMDLMKKTIPVDVEKFEPVFDTLPGTIEVGLPQNIVERNKVVLAFGIALSSNAYTPNFIYTYRDKLKKIKQRKINIAVAMFIIILFLGCAMVYSWQKTVESRETVKLNTLSQRKSTVAKDVNPKATLKLISDAKTKLNLMSQYVSAYLPLAVINEICSLTPKNIRISSLESDFDVPGKKENRKKVKSKDLIAQVMIEGKVLPMENNPESDLTQYLLGLRGSQLFENIKVLQKSTYKDQEDTGLNFKLTMDVL